MYILGNIFSDVFASFLNALGYLLAVFYSVIPSAGIAIILLTMLLRLNFMRCSGVLDEFVPTGTLDTRYAALWIQFFVEQAKKYFFGRTFRH